MFQVTLTDLARLPPEQLARLLLEWAAQDRSLLSRLHGTIAEAAPAADGAGGPERPAATPAGPDFVGASPAMRELKELIDRFARTDEPVLITGESGTGKELAARAIHDRSRRAGGPFAAVNCAAIPANLIASELFGYEKGAFTGATARTRGQVEHANGGTLFLDEIGDMPVDLQGYLLRFLQEGQIVRVGGRESVAVDVRIVAATNVQLRQAIAEARFREDLFYRLNVLALTVPPLRDRREDIALLAGHFLREAAREFGREVAGFAPDALALLHRYPWPGNVRELMSMVRRAVIIGSGPVVERSDLAGLEEVDRSAVPAPPAVSTRPPPRSTDEKEALLEVLAGTGENVALAARQWGVSRVTMYRMLRRHDIVPARGFMPAPGAGTADGAARPQGAAPDGNSSASASARDGLAGEIVPSLQDASTQVPARPISRNSA